MMYGNEDQKLRWLPRLASGQAVGAFCQHESGSGHDFAGMQTKAIASDATDGQFYMHGTKNWVTNGGIADLFLVYGKIYNFEPDPEEVIIFSNYNCSEQTHVRADA